MPARRPPAPGELDRERLARIRLIFSDLDETLLGPDHRIGERSRAAIRRLMDLGVTFVVCTGRAPQASRPIVRELGGRFLVCANGAAVFDGDQLLAGRTLPAPLVAEMLAFFAEREVPAYLVTPTAYFVTRRTPEVAAADAARGYAPPLLPPGQEAQPAYKVMALAAAHLYDEVRARWGDRAHIIYHPAYLEVAPLGVTKAWGAQVITERLGVDPQEVAAIGDARNDIELVQWAGVGVAVANADPLLLEVADAVARDHAQDGAADLFEAILAAREG
ncbi:MAG: Cof-type HAD-IIB family hydrolase [Firmicutes bacterium]|nr:Cof-type HAD-IIB family hydrolase [Bacillota bacterium]